MTDEDVQNLLRRHRFASAFELLLDRYQQKVFRSVYSILKEAGRAEEVTQDVFLKMWQVLPDYDGRASLSTWLYAIARNTSLSALRAESYRKTLAIEDFEAPPANWKDGPQQLEIKQLVQRLPDVQQQVITLFYLQDRALSDCRLGWTSG